ncbi:c-type cytochrome [Lacibacter luteus]|uniref:C-type cytochrome n=1 Tax=Lacibacter luteus TaxID=2508719 RepID=A0A4Q1CDK6_9BACT|nr:cytochrome c peroxidase [Lacibacter luteus]RXK57735.1 c-type cytochrome [Lacibacter luteus]
MNKLQASIYNKSYQLLTVVAVLVLIVFCSAYLITPATNKPNEKVDAWYLQQLSKLKAELKLLQKQLSYQKSIATCQQQFKQARVTYKKVAVLIDHFNSYETKYLNGPNLQRTEDDNPDVIIEPHGFQVLEEYLFAEQKSLDQAKAETDELLYTVEKLETEADRSYKFQDEEVWEALQLSVIRMITLGISGFDSPVAQYSLPESKATLEGVAAILLLYKPAIDKKDPLLYQQLVAATNKAESFLSASSFEAFDRLTFITQFANPLSTLLNKTRSKLGYNLSTGLRPLNNTNTIFETNAFNVDFFSPTDRYRMTADRIALGKKLFYDSILSGNGKRSCASCHQPAKAFTDGRVKALSLDEKHALLRNTPTLWNAVFQTKQFYDSRTSVLENQLSEVVHNTEEMKGSLKESMPALQNNNSYATLFQKAYPDEKEFISEYNIANAISSYVRSLIAMNSRFDQYMRGNKTALSVVEKKGFNLFMGKAKCGTCHFMPLFNGMVPPEFTEAESEVLGVPQTNDTVHPVLDPDLGKFNFTRSVVHKHAFKTPTLRNIDLTAPYMHNGVFATLEEVMEFYNRGGGNGLHIAPANQTLPADKLQLSRQEIAAIISFMKTLTDTSGIKRMLY